MNRRTFITGFLLLIFCFCGTFADVSSSAQTGREPVTATIKIGKHSNFVRIVFSTTEEHVQKASVILTGNNIIKVDFQAPASFKTPEKGILRSEAPLEIAAGVRVGVKGSSCAITVENLDDINVSKLSTPARLVIDAYVSKPTKEEKAFMDTQIEGSSIPMETFMIDPGHGGYDSGIRGKNFAEKDIAMSFAKEFGNALDKKGKKVFLTRKGDQVLSIKDRIKTANQKSPEIFISIHLSSKNEFGIYYAPKITGQNQLQREKATGQDIDKDIANAVADNIKNDFGVNVRRERLPVSVIAYVNSPAFLVELPNPEKFNYDKKTKERLVNAILKGIASIGSKVKGQGASGGK